MAAVGMVRGYEIVRRVFGERFGIQGQLTSRTNFLIGPRSSWWIEKLLDQLLVGRDPNEVFAKDGLFDDLIKALSEML